jgi:hypothetical protein
LKLKKGGATDIHSSWFEAAKPEDRIPSQLECHPDEGQNQTHDMRNMQTLNRKDAKNAKKESTAERRTFS